MAIDDVISDFETSVAATAILSIQPASGDEWLVTQINCPGTMLYGLLSQTVTQALKPGHYGGETAESQDLGDVGTHPIKFLLTNSDYLRVQNNSGSTREFGYSAIKTKD